MCCLSDGKEQCDLQNLFSSSFAWWTWMTLLLVTREVSLRWTRDGSEIYFVLLISGTLPPARVWCGSVREQFLGVNNDQVGEEKEFQLYCKLSWWSKLAIVTKPGVKCAGRSVKGMSSSINPVVFWLLLTAISSLNLRSVWLCSILNRFSFH